MDLKLCTNVTVELAGRDDLHDFVQSRDFIRQKNIIINMSVSSYPTDRVNTADSNKFIAKFKFLLILYSISSSFEQFYDHKYLYFTYLSCRQKRRPLWTSAHNAVCIY